MDIAAAQGCSGDITEESYSPTAHFHTGLRDKLSASLPGAPLLSTGAGHDAGVLAPHIQTGMLFVRNPSGISRSPEEHAEDTNLETGNHGPPRSTGLGPVSSPPFLSPL